MMRTICLAGALMLFWLALSGYYTPYFITIGILSVLLAVFLATRMQTIDAEGVPIQLLLGAVTYLPWLLWEIAKSAWTVTRIIIDPRMPISPTMTRVSASQRTPTAVCFYANSITLTPGTLTTNVNGYELTVHALVSEGADDLEAGTMDRRVSRFEKGL